MFGYQEELIKFSMVISFQLELEDSNSCRISSPDLSGLFSNNLNKKLEQVFSSKIQRC
jgi:hypothetical protein